MAGRCHHPVPRDPGPPGYRNRLDDPPRRQPPPGPDEQSFVAVNRSGGGLHLAGAGHQVDVVGADRTVVTTPRRRRHRRQRRAAANDRFGRVFWQLRVAWDRRAHGAPDRSARSARPWRSPAGGPGGRPGVEAGAVIGSARRTRRPPRCSAAVSRSTVVSCVDRRAERCRAHAHSVATVCRRRTGTDARRAPEISFHGKAVGPPRSIAATGSARRAMAGRSPDWPVRSTEPPLSVARDKSTSNLHEKRPEAGTARRTHASLAACVHRSVPASVAGRSGRPRPGTPPAWTN